MRIALCIPPWDFTDTHFESLQTLVAGKWPPSGILYIAAMLRQEGHDIRIFDGIFYDMETMLRDVEAYRPDVLGISTVALLWKRAKRLARRIKERLPDLFVMAGGQGPSALMERALQECDALDAVAYLEGEHTAVEVLQRLQEGRGLAGVQGTIYRDADTVVTNPPRPLIEDLDALPFPAVELIDVARYTPSLGQYIRLPIGEITSSRGCVNECLYCYKIGGSRIRLRSAENVVDEMEYWVRTFQVREIKFWDENFAYDADRVMAICDEIRRRHLDIVWSASARVDAVKRDVLQAMKSAGCWCIQYGIESGVQKNLDTIRKNTDLQMIRRAVRLTGEAGIQMINTFILGIPGETVDEALQTIDFAIELNSEFVEFFPCTPFPGTDLARDIDRFGRLVAPLDQMGMHRLPFVPFTMTEEVLENVRNLAWRRYYLRPRYVSKMLLNIRTPFDVKVRIDGLRAVLSMRGACRER